jgi:hypothetical protein
MAPSRKGNKKQKKSRSCRRQHGGAAASLSLPQGVDFASRHMNQHGGALLTGAPVGYTGMLPPELRMVARVGGLDDSIAAAAGQRDPDQMPLPVLAQKGGRRRKSGRKSRKSGRKSRKSGRKSRKSRKERKQHGGFRHMEGAPLSDSTSLLPPHLAAKAGTADFSNPLLKA